MIEVYLHLTRRKTHLKLNLEQIRNKTCSKMAHSLVSISTLYPRFIVSNHNFSQKNIGGIPHCITKIKELKVPICPSSRDRSSMFCSKALGSDVSEDTDDMYDDLFEKYGKVVFTRTDQKPPDAEVDDDAESLSFAVAMAKVANEVKAEDIKVLFVKPLVYWTRFFIIATAFSRPQLDAIRTKMANLAEEKFGKVPNGDSKPNSWTLLDFGDVVVHLFLPPQRAFYNLEEFYGNATSIELPFEDENSFQR